MKIGLFIPCFMNELYPEACMSTLKILENLGYDVEYPMAQTCCGQPQANTGCANETRMLAERFFKIFKDYDYIVSPSGSCAGMVRNHYAQFLGGRDGFERMRSHTFELVEFLLEVAKVDKLDVSFPHKVGIHNSCHSHRGIGMGSMSEQNVAEFSKLKTMLDMVSGISFAELTRKDECCGFGGTFCVTEEAMSAAMGKARVQDHLDAGSEYITSGDLSCMMHMEGIINREKLPLKIVHIAQIIAGDIS